MVWIWEIKFKLKNSPNEHLRTEVGEFYFILAGPYLEVYINKLLVRPLALVSKRNVLKIGLAEGKILITQKDLPIQSYHPT